MPAAIQVSRPQTDAGPGAPFPVDGGNSRKDPIRAASRKGTPRSRADDGLWKVRMRCVSCGADRPGGTVLSGRRLALRPPVIMIGALLPRGYPRRVRTTLVDQVPL